MAKTAMKRRTMDGAQSKSKPFVWYKGKKGKWAWKWVENSSKPDEIIDDEPSKPDKMRVSGKMFLSVVWLLVLLLGWALPPQGLPTPPF